MREMMPQVSNITHAGQSWWQAQVAALMQAVQESRSHALAGRSLRVVVLLLVIGILNLIDLALTILAVSLGGFDELNPLASPLLDSSGHLIAFKIAMVSPALFTFLLLRRHRLTEVSCWMLSLVYAYLSVRWIIFYCMAATG